jgi:Uma2 family endonuclease
MSRPAVAALAPLPFELVYDDGVPLESRWHRLQMNLLIDGIRQGMAERERTDYFVGGNMFVYYSYEQARDVAAGRSYFRGPDVFYVSGVAIGRERNAWVTWEEEGRLPEVIFELLSPSTAGVDRTEKKALYAHTFRTAEYFLYEPGSRKPEGFRLAGDDYLSLVPNGAGRLWSERLGLEIGLWRGVYQDLKGTWVRLFRSDGSLVPTPEEAAVERAAAAETRAAAAVARAAAAESELERLRTLLGEGG